MEQKQLEGNMKGFRAFTAVGLAFFAFFCGIACYDALRRHAESF